MRATGDRAHLQRPTRHFRPNYPYTQGGSRNGVTAVQMDIKIQGLSRTILEQALQQAKRGRMFKLPDDADSHGWGEG
jgi:hypothetical protein